MSTYGYAVEQIGGAVHALATAEGDLRSRLRQASHLIPFAPPTDLPGELAQRLRELQNELHELEVETATRDELFGFTDRLVACCYEMLRRQNEFDG
jgi:hypothetical protein